MNYSGRLQGCSKKHESENFKVGRCQNVCFHQLIAKDLRQDDQDLKELGQNDFPLKFPCFIGQMAKCSRGNCQQFIKHLRQLGWKGGPGYFVNYATD